MKVLIEEYRYDVSLVRKYLHDIDELDVVEGLISVSYVGYYYNNSHDVNDCVFILPKVLIDGNNKVFGKYTPEEIIDLDKSDKLTKDERNFIYEFAVWIYRAIAVFKNSQKDTSIVRHKQVVKVGKGKKRLSNTYLDILLSLIQFNKENQDFFMFILKNIHSGFNKINWARTISRSNAVVQNGEPIYINPVNKKRQINFDEELLVIYFSILNYISDKFGFAISINCNYDLIKGKRFEHYLEKFGVVRLRQIKYKYFSDKALKLWELCFAFFEQTHQVKVNSSLNEYLLVKNFYIVFETIIDELVGDNPLPDNMDKKQEDGKIVDHLFTAKSLIENEKNPTYYIGDSKYYKLGHELSDESIYKQYTYARNVIQWNLDIFNSGKEPESGVRLRDDITEGYNIIPNFFISAKMDEDFDYGNDGIDKTNRKNNKHRKVHFKNRLFDRDTLLLFHYDVNFLFVLSLYARDNSIQKAAWKEKIRKIFRNEIQNWLQQDYDFYAMKSRGNTLAGEEFIKDHFKDLQGKIYRPFDDESIYALALEKEDNTDTQKSDTFVLLQDFFEITKIEKLGEDPKEKLDQMVSAYQTAHPYTPIPENWLPQYHIERYADEYFVIGMYHDKAHWDWITGKNDRGSLIYNIRLDKNRDGSMPKSRIRAMKPKFAILYEEGHDTENKYHVFRIHDYAVMTEKRMKEAKYPREPKGDYFIFRFDEEVSIGSIDIAELIGIHRLSTSDYKDGMPIFMKGSELIKYRTIL